MYAKHVKATSQTAMIFGATSIQSKKHLETSLALIQTLHGWLTSNLTLIQKI